MFDSFKDRFAKLEEDHESIRRAKQHVEKYQVVYATVGGSAITLVAVKLFGRPQVIVKGTESLPSLINAPVFNNMPVISIVNNPGHCTKVVQDLETGNLWPKVGQLAAELAEQNDIPFETARQYLSRHLNGHTEHVFGKQYRTIALGTTG